MAKIQLRLTERQAEAIDHPARELLLGGDDRRPGGRSYALRTLGLLECNQRRGTKAILVSRSSFTVADEHVYGATGLLSTLAPLRTGQGIKVAPQEVRFPGQSTLRWMGLKDDRDLHAILAQDPDLVLVDDVDRLPEDLYRRLADHVLATGRVIAATRSQTSTWVGRRWNGSEVEGRAHLELLSEHLSEDLRSDEEEAPLPFRDFCALAMPTVRWVKAREVMADALEDLIYGKLKDATGKRIDRLMMRAPAQLGKTTVVALASAYWLWLNPEKTGAGASYSAPRAQRLSYLVREFYLNAGGRLRADSKGVGYWKTAEGGGWWAMSPDTGGAGDPANLLVEDDLDKDIGHALQASHQKKVRSEWYSPVWLNRWNAEHGRLLEINIGTPHDREDSQNYILNTAGAGEEEASRHWYAVVLQAILDRDRYPIEPDLPEGTVLADDWREPGEPLCGPGEDLAKFTKAAIERMIETMPASVVAAMIFCTPMAAVGGGVIHREWFVRRGLDPGQDDEGVYTKTVRAWDFGHTEGGGDATSGSKVGLEASTNRLVWRHNIRAWKAGGGVKRLVAMVALIDGPECVVRIPDDPSAGKSWASEVIAYVRKIHGWLGIQPPQLVAKPVSGSKIARANRIVHRAQPPRADLPVDEENRGTVDIYGGDWRPRLPEAVPSFHEVMETASEAAKQGDQQAAERLAELKAIATLARAAFHDDPSNALARSQNVDYASWRDQGLEELRMFDGLPGHADDVADSLGDAIEECSAGGKWLIGGV